MPKNGCEAKLRSLDDIFTDALTGRFDEAEYKAWLEREPLALAYYVSDGGNTLLHLAAHHDEGAITDILLKAGADPHKENDDGQTPLNFAAANSPSAGRRMTLHWYARAKQGERPGLNDVSGSHDTPLIQYAAKWCNAETLEEMLNSAHEITLPKAPPEEGEVQIAALEEHYKERVRIDPFVANEAGWTPLHAAACMPGRTKAVAVIAKAYEQQPDFLLMKTVKPYTATYRSPKGEAHVTYPAGCTAIGLIEQRLAQDKTLTHSERVTLQHARQVIGESQHRAAPFSVENEIF